MSRVDDNSGTAKGALSAERVAEQSLLHTLELARATDALQKAVLERHRAEKVRAVLAAIGERLNTTTTPDGAALVILDAADELFGWDAALVDVYDPDRALFFGVARFDTVGGKRVSITPSTSGHPMTPLRKRLFEDGPILVLRKDDSQLTEERLVSFGSTSRKSASLMFAPINRSVRRAGILSVQSYTPEAYDDADLELLQILADYCCTGLERTFADLRAHEAERTCRLLLEAAPMITYRVDQNLMITAFSAGSPVILGLNPRDYVGGKLSVLISGAKVIASHKSALAGVREQVVIKLGTQSFQCILAPLHDANGTVVGCEAAGCLTPQ